MLHPYTTFKNEQSKIASSIHDLRITIRESAGCYAGREQSQLNTLQQLYRARHIAYCEARGRTREQIENNPRPLTPWMQHAMEKKILEFKTELQAQVAKADAEWAAQHPVNKEEVA